MISLRIAMKLIELLPPELIEFLLDMPGWYGTCPPGRFCP